MGALLKGTFTMTLSWKQFSFTLLRLQNSTKHQKGQDLKREVMFKQSFHTDLVLFILFPLKTDAAVIITSIESHF